MHGRMVIPLSSSENINATYDLERGVEIRSSVGGSTKFGVYEILRWKEPEDSDCELMVSSPSFFLAFVPILSNE